MTEDIMEKFNYHLDCMAVIVSQFNALCSEKDKIISDSGNNDICIFNNNERLQQIVSDMFVLTERFTFHDNKRNELMKSFVEHQIIE